MASKSSIWSEFKEFIARGSVMDMAVGIAVGAAFASIAKSLVEDVLMPPIGLLLAGADFDALFVVLQDVADHGPYATAEAAKAAGAVIIYYGKLIQSVVSFLVIAITVFLLIRAVNRLKRAREEEVEPTPAAPRDKPCPYCAMTIPREAVRCPECTSQLDDSPELSAAT